MSDEPDAGAVRRTPSLCDVVLYFLRLGALGFGGPVALANYMRRDLVEARGWITDEEYENGLALAAACPGPLAYQMHLQYLCMLDPSIVLFIDGDPASRGPVTQG